MKQVVVDKASCIGCRMCTQFAPNTFSIGEDGTSEAKNPPADSEDKIEKAIQSCPVSCISWLEE